MTRIARWLAAALLAVAPMAAPAVTCTEDRFEGHGFTVCTVDATTQALATFLYDDTGARYGDFDRLSDALEAEGRALIFAMNGGMYHRDGAPVGHYVEKGQTLRRVITAPSGQNFGMLPNGILCIRDNRADVIETLAFAARSPDCRFATQSGPMLVIDGALHPRFFSDSPYVKQRNGVGTTPDGRTAYFVVSARRVNFDTFARFFRDVLNVNQALYLDGSDAGVSRLFAPQIGRNDRGRAMGPIIGVTTPRAP